MIELLHSMKRLPRVGMVLHPISQLHALMSLVQLNLNHQQT